jgi:hypothetical protein
MASAEYVIEIKGPVDLALFDPNVAHDEIDEDPSDPPYAALAKYRCGDHTAFEEISIACFAAGLDGAGRRMHATAVNTKRHLYTGPPLAVFALWGDAQHHCYYPTFDRAYAEAGAHGFEEQSASDYYTDSLAEIAFEDLKRSRAARV